MTEISALDCTLRDGGYYNNWDFLPELVEKYLAAIAKSGVRTVELGFRFPPQEKFLGASAYTTDDYLRQLSIPPELEVAVMINAGDLISDPVSPEAFIERTFDQASNSPVSLVRIASHVREVDDCRDAIKKLKDLGYKVGLNIMQITVYDPDVVEELVKRVAGWKIVDILYFADSLGNMDSRQVADILASLKKNWSGPIGMHAHNNMGAALPNSLAALEHGATWIDGTVCGMGRGAGNVQIEYLLFEMRQRGFGDFDAEAIFPLALNDFEALRDTHHWGTNIYYYLSAAYGIHPTYVQEILKTGQHEASHTISALKNLHLEDAKSYSRERLSQALELGVLDSDGSWDATGWAKGRDVLILGSGPWIYKHVDSVKAFIDAKRPLVICLNTSTPIDTGRIDAFAACQALRVVTESDKYGSLGVPIIAPAFEVDSEIQDAIGKDKFFDYGVRVTPNAFHVNATGCEIPHQLVAAYALAFCHAANARKILLAGFDGYEPGNTLQEQMEEVFLYYGKLADPVPIVAVTPTTYSVPQSSLFAPME